MRKYWKKAFALVAALLMAFAVAAPALADTEKGTIKISNPKDGATYTAYQVFKATADSNGKVTYTLEDTDIISKIWADSSNAVKEGASPNRVIKINGLILTETATDKFEVEKTTDYTAAAFAKTLTGYGFGSGDLASVKKYELKNDTDPKYTADNVDGGYYFVISSDLTESNPSLTTVLELEPGQTVRVENKNDYPFDKVIDGVGTGTQTNETETTARGYETNDTELSGINIGDTVYFKITGEVPETAEYTRGYTYLVTDKMDSGLTFNNDVKVTIGKADDNPAGIPVTPQVTTAATVGDDQIKYADNGFTLKLDLKQYETGEGEAKKNSRAGQTITITYSATVNENAHAVLEGNKARLEYSNDPTTDSTGKIDDRVDVYNYDIVIDKYEAGDERQKLSGAEFYLYKWTTNKVVEGVSTSDPDGVIVEEATAKAAASGYTKYYYTETKDSTTQKVTAITWTAADTNGAVPTNATPKTTDENGAASFIGLKEGTPYYLEETKAPTGYKIRETPFVVTINAVPAGIASLTQAEQHANLTSVASVPNTPGENLPSTGGMGTTIFYMASAVVFAIIVLRTMRRDQDQVA